MLVLPMKWSWEGTPFLRSRVLYTKVICRAKPPPPRGNSMCFLPSCFGVCVCVCAMSGLSERGKRVVSVANSPAMAAAAPALVSYDLQDGIVIHVSLSQGETSISPDRGE